MKLINFLTLNATYRPWTVTTLFQMRDARSVMPCIDLPFMKATLDICITHPPGTEARYISPLEIIRIIRRNMGYLGHLKIAILQYMSEFTGFDYPLKKLSLFSTSLPVNGVENFGLIVLNERWMAYPKYRMAHSILAHEIAHQWIGNIVTVKKWNEICLQVHFYLTFSIHY
ncbi:unnamed protein product [Anisakis simplex]|uniref:Matrix non-peptidase homolog 1 (inferred by orthology to a C. elegans protein) n=1 Tax=Anisakis simplex TaxID=6269 RepID=A0A0M3KEB4_ANISI|nr:unnamed protein product [Anisakis simplex]